MVYLLQHPDPRPGLNTAVQAEITYASQAALQVRLDGDNTFWAVNQQYEHEDATGVEAQSTALNRVQYDDMTDGDGNGETIPLQRLFISIDGANNASGKRISGYLLCHMVEMNVKEAFVRRHALS